MAEAKMARPERNLPEWWEKGSLAISPVEHTARYVLDWDPDTALSTFAYFERGFVSQIYVDERVIGTDEITRRTITPEELVVFIDALKSRTGGKDSSDGIKRVVREARECARRLIGDQIQDLIRKMDQI